jgi:glucose/arabinose dehydrogenase
MRTSASQRRALLTTLALLAALVLGSPCAQAQHAGSAAGACPGNNGGLKLISGFCATVFADKLGHPRHMVVAPDGVVYVNTWSGVYYGNDKPPAG